MSVTLKKLLEQISKYNRHVYLKHQLYYNMGFALAYAQNNIELLEEALLYDNPFQIGGTASEYIHLLFDRTSDGYITLSWHAEKGITVNVLSETIFTLEPPKEIDWKAVPKLPLMFAASKELLEHEDNDLNPVKDILASL